MQAHHLVRVRPRGRQHALALLAVQAQGLVHEHVLAGLHGLCDNAEGS